MRRKPVLRIGCLIILTMVCVFVAQAPAENATVADKAELRWTASSVEKTIAELQTQIKTFEQAETTETAQKLGVSLYDLRARNSKYGLLKSAYSELLTHRKKKDDLAAELLPARADLAAQEQQGMAKKPPYSLSFYDVMVQEATTVDQRMESALNSLDASKRSLEDLQSRQEAILKNRRNLKEKSDTAGDGENRVELSWQADLLDLDKQANEVLLEGERSKLENLKTQRDILELKTKLYQQKIAWVRGNLSFDQADLDQQLAAFDKKNNQLEETLVKLTAEKNDGDEAFRKARIRIEKSAGSEEFPAAQAALKTRDLQRQTIQTLLEQTQESLRLVPYQKQVWQYRYDLLKGAMASEQILQRQQDVDLHLKKLGRMINAEQNQQSSLMQQIDTIENQLGDDAFTTVEKRQFAEQLRALQQQIRYHLDFSAVLTSTQLLDRRFSDELNLHLTQEPILDTASRWVGKLSGVWQFELWVIDDNSVTVRKVIFALVILIIGFIGAKSLIRKTVRLLLMRSPLRQTTAVTIEKLFSYFAYVMVLLLALRIVNIPLAAFAFLGGAVAIGIGFGAQNLINNFISGFIIMGEKPISINDLIEVDGVLGRVEEIGARCTRVRTGENIDILVPNSAFLEKNITNWTLIDTTIRTHVNVGVAYGSPVERVEKLLLQAAADIENIAKTPEPFVLFTDFGDNALMFEVYFWINVRRVIERRMIESRLRFRIDALFRDAGLVIAFPQRDMHLYTHEPLSVKMVGNDADS